MVDLVQLDSDIVVVSNSEVKNSNDREGLSVFRTLDSNFARTQPTKKLRHVCWHNVQLVILCICIYRMVHAPGTLFLR